ncbi:MAG: DUF6029 family protein [Parvicellaceae bacterium]
MKIKLFLLVGGLISFNLTTSQNSQEPIDIGTFSGNIQSIAQYYQEDSLINAALPDHIMGFNGFTNLNYNRGNFTAGVRFESYLNTLEGYPTTFQGTGLGYRYANWKNEALDVTIGSFYEQYGSGMILRAYEERQLGIDNALDGVKVKYNPYKGIYLKGLVGKQRHLFNDGLTNGNGIIRGLDGEIDVNELLDSLNDSKFRLTIGGSFVSKFNDDNNTPDFILPKNVGSYAARFGMRYSKFRFSGEYVYKINDPYPYNLDDRFNYIYKNGEGLLLNLGYSKKGFAVDLSAKHMDNMLWRSTNVRVGPTDLMIGYLPAQCKQHTYNLAATLYPYATNFFGEISYQLDVLYKIPKKTLLGGKYGTSISMNFATAYVPERTFIDDLNSSRNSYQTSLFSMSDSILYQDFNIEIKRKINKKLKFNINYFNFIFNDDAVKVAEYYKMIYAQIAVIDLSYKINDHHSLRFETQAMWTQQHKGNWLFGQIEYTFSPHWYVAVLDQYNYGNPVAEQRLHYALVSAGYINGPHRFSMQYGRQRAGVFCVGGVCRAVPASNGLTFTLTSSF